LKPFIAFLLAVFTAAWWGCSRSPEDPSDKRPAESPAAATPGPHTPGPGPQDARSATPGPESPTTEPGTLDPSRGPGERPGVTSGGADPASAGPPEETPGDVPAPITTEAGLRTALRAKNPDFGGELVARFDPRSGLVQIALQDPALHDISPLANAQPLISALAGGGAGEPGAPQAVAPVAIGLGKTRVKDLSPLAEIDGLVALDLAKTKVRDLAPLSGKPIQELYLEETGVEDIGPLKGMPLVKLYLSYTKVSDLGPLKGAPLDELNIIGTQVADLSPLEGSRLRMLWLSECPVTDLAPLQKVPLESLTLAKTKVSDLSPLKGHPTLRRLHIAETEVTDLTPIKWLKLTRLIFTPARIEKGIGFARDMKTINEIGTSFDGMMHPSQFWRMYEAGAFRNESR